MKGKRLLTSVAAIVGGVCFCWGATSPANPAEKAAPTVGAPAVLVEPEQPSDGDSRSDCAGDVIIGTQATTTEAYPLSGIIATTYARSMSLIRRSEFTTCTPYKITHLAIDINSAKTMNFNSVEIRMKKVTTTAFPSATVP